MKKALLSAAAIFALLGIISCGEVAPDQNTAETSTEAEKIEGVENGLLSAVVVKGGNAQGKNILEQMEHYGVPGVSIAVINNGAIEWAKGYGLLKKGGRSVDSESLFRATQITHAVTSLAVLKLAEEGKLDLDEDINEKLSSWHVPENEFTTSEKVTLRRILSHSAGLSVPYFRSYTPEESIPTLIQVFDGLEPAKNKPLRVVVAPGEKWRYSVGGYALIEQLVADALNADFINLMKEYVLVPSAMNHSVFSARLPVDFSENIAAAYDDKGELVEPVHPELAAVGLWTTPSDLANLVITIRKSFTGESTNVFSQDISKEIMTNQIDNWGLGFVVGGEGQDRHFSLEGHGSNYLCYLVGYLSQGKGAIIMTNASSGENLTKQIMRSIARAYDWPDFGPQEVETVVIPEESLNSITGSYLIERFKEKVQLQIIDDVLFFIRENREPKELLAIADDLFIEQMYGIQYRIERDETGSVTGLTWVQNGRDFFTMPKTD